MSPAKLSRVVAMLGSALSTDHSDGQSADGTFGDGGNASTLSRGGQSSSSLEPAEFAVTGSPLLGDSSSVKVLGWLIPVVIVAVFAMIGLAFACYYGVRRLELRMLHWCREHCTCCCDPDEENGRLLMGESYDSLTQTRRKETVRLRDFRERAPSYGVTRDRGEEYVPRKNFNPFDED